MIFGLSSWSQKFLVSAVLLVQISIYSLADDGSEEVFPHVTLSNDRVFPLVGMGVGNLEQELIEETVSAALSSGLGYKMIDTAHASKNEAEVSAAIDLGLQGLGEEDDKTVHVVTKVWYTHLGYERTQFSVKESLKALRPEGLKSDIRVHVLLHWPRCFDEIEWMDCDGEEEALPDEVKNLGSPPHLSPDLAWQQSWKALEDMYENEEYKIESIGVSNFDSKDIAALIGVARIAPHILQGNIWSLLNDEELPELLSQNKIHFQAYDVMNGVVNQEEQAPNAFNLLERFGHGLGDDISEDHGPFTPAQVILAWLIQSNVSIIPRASSFDHMEENGPKTVGEVPPMDPDELDTVEQAAWSLLMGEDMAASATFVNKHEDTLLKLFWSHEDTGEEVPVLESLEPGETFETNTHPGHVFIAYSEDMARRSEVVVQADYGQHEEFALEL